MFRANIPLAGFRVNQDLLEESERVEGLFESVAHFVPIFLSKFLWWTIEDSRVRRSHSDAQFVAGIAVKVPIYLSVENVTHSHAIDLEHLELLIVNICNLTAPSRIDDPIWRAAETFLLCKS